MWMLLLSLAAAADCPTAVSTVDGLDPTDARWKGTVLFVQKEARQLGVYREGRLVDGACWTVALAHGYVPGTKQRRGDLRTPEGWSRISDRPWSQFYSALSVHYPRAEDAARGLKQGLVSQEQHDSIVFHHERGSLPPRGTRLGGDIVIHGGGGSPDWTLGCVGMEDDDIDAMRTLLPEDKRGWVMIAP